MAELDCRGDWLATAHNGQVRAGEGSAAAAGFREGDRVEILSPMQGG